MTQYKPTFRTNFSINADFFLAICLGLIAWQIFPSTMKYWGFGFISILTGLSAVGVFLRAIKTIFRLRRIQREIEDFHDHGDRPTGASTANDQTLKDAGVLGED